MDRGNTLCPFHHSSRGGGIIMFNPLNSGVSDVDSSFLETGHIHCYKKGFQSTTGNGIANSVEPVEMAQ